MNSGRKFFHISMAISFVLGIFFPAYFDYLEHQARQTLPPEMRTPEAIQYYYDGSVCLGCDIAGRALMLLFFSIGTLIFFCWLLFEAFYTKQESFK